MRSARDGYSPYLTKPYAIDVPSNTNWQDIGGGQIGTDQIYGQAITESQLADGSISSAKIGAISADDITTGTLDASSVTVTNLDADNINTGTLNGTRIEDLAITNGKLANNAVTSAKIQTGTIVASDIASGTITTTQIAAGTIVASDIAAGTITTTQIAAGTITASNIASNTITAAEMSTTDAYVFGKLNVNISGSYGINGNSIGYGSLHNLSDERLKESVKTIDGGLNIVGKLRPVIFRWNEKAQKNVGVLPKDRRYGFIAQEVANVVSEWVDESDGYYRVEITSIIPVLVAAVQEQQAQIEELKTQVAELQGN